nr:MAG TPA: hypothetical protein [Caudoviricetes sp.]
MPSNTQDFLYITSDKYKVEKNRLFSGFRRALPMFCRYSAEYGIKGRA